MKRSLVLLVGLGFTLLPAGAQPAYYVTPDLPVILGGEAFLPSTVVLNDLGTYSPALSLPVGIPIDALHRLDNGDWLFSLALPRILSGTSFEPRDLVQFNGVTHALLFDGSAAGVPANASIDAFFAAGSGTWILSFDIPVTIGGVSYDPADLVRFVAGPGFDPVPFFDASSLVPPLSTARNVTGVALRGGDTIMTFDLPTDLGTLLALPGQLIAWNGASFSLFDEPPGWPTAKTRLEGLAFVSAGVPGSVPLLTVDLSPSGNVILSWAASCSAGAGDYAVYEGALGTWYSHSQTVCTDAPPLLTEEIPNVIGNRYYLVIPLNSSDEGSYGRRRNGGALSERPAGNPGRCLPSQDLGCP